MEGWLKILGTEIAHEVTISPVVLLLLGTSGMHTNPEVYFFDAFLERMHHTAVA